MRWYASSAATVLAMLAIGCGGMVAATAPAAQQDSGKPGTSYPPPGPGTPAASPAPVTTPAPSSPATDPPKAAPYPQDSGDGPRGSSQHDPDEDRYDAVGYAISSADAGGFGAGVALAAHRSLPVGSFAEVTELNGGRTILVKIAAQGPPEEQGLIDLAPGAAKSLGLTPGATLPVRVRKVGPNAQDAAAIKAGGAPPRRLDAPESLLKPLRKQIPAPPGQTPPIRSVEVAPSKDSETPASPPIKSEPTAKPASPEPTTKPERAVAGSYYVQVAALSHEARARTLAGKLDGYVEPGGGLYRIRIGPFDTRLAAEKERAKVARRGYDDARVYRHD